MWQPEDRPMEGITLLVHGDIQGTGVPFPYQLCGLRVPHTHVSWRLWGAGQGTSLHFTRPGVRLEEAKRGGARLAGPEHRGDLRGSHASRQGSAM